ncbi:hypothetical protein CHUAL_005473 [Chamberlinius hualienensis]
MEDSKRQLAKTSDAVARPKSARYGCRTKPTTSIGRRRTSQSLVHNQEAHQGDDLLESRMGSLDLSCRSDDIAIVDKVEAKEGSERHSNCPPILPFEAVLNASSQKVLDRLKDRQRALQSATGLPLNGVSGRH